MPRVSADMRQANAEFGVFVRKAGISLDAVTRRFELMPARDAATYGIMLSTLFLRKVPDQAMNLYERMDPNLKNEVIMGKVVEGLSRAKKIDEAKEVMRSGDAKPNFKCFQSVILGMVAAGRSVEALEVAQEMLTSRVRPQKVVIFGQIAKGLAEEGHLDKMPQLFECVIAANHRLDSQMYTPWIKALVERDNIAEMERVAQQMKRSRTYPNGIIYGIMMQGYYRREDYHAVEKLYGEVKRYCRRDREAADNVMFTVLRAQKRFNEAEQLSRQIGSRDAVTDNISLGVLVDQGKFDEARERLLLHANDQTYDIVMRGLLKKKRYLEIVALFEKMKERRISPGCKVINTLIDMHVERGGLDDAKELFRQYKGGLGIKAGDKAAPVNCHNLSYGTAFAHVLVFLDTWKRYRPFGVIVGNQSHSRNNGAMRSELTRLIGLHCRYLVVHPYIYQRDKNEHPGRIRIEWKKTHK